MNLAMRNETFTEDALTRWGTFRVVRARSDGRVWLSYMVDDGVDPTSYLVREILNGRELSAQVEAEDRNAENAARWGT